jgi:hypothetical protein
MTGGVWVAGLFLVVASSLPLFADGNLASRPIDLPDLVLNNDLSLSQAEYTLETGKMYRIHILSDGEEQFEFLAPELFRNVWLDQIVIDGLKVKSYGIYSLEFDDEGTFEMTFVPIRPGRYDFWVDGYENRGMKGAFMVN